MLNALANVRLLVLDNGVVEVAHEALFRVWPLLAEWLEEEREFLVGKSRIEKSREDYSGLDEQDRAKGLLSGILLERAKDWLIDHPGRFSTDEAAFIRASIEEAERQQRELAQQRERLREAELAHAHAEAERAMQQTAAAQKFLRSAIAAAAVLAVLVGFSIYLWLSAGAAERQAKTNFNLAVDQAASNVDTLVDSYQAGRIATSLLGALIARAQATLDKLQSDTSEAAAAKVKLLRAVSRADIVLSRASLAEQKAREALGIADRFLARAPADPEWMHLGLRAREQLGQSLFWKGDLPAALEYLRAAMATARKLVELHPDNDVYKQDLIEIHRFTGDGLRNQGNIDQALAEYESWRRQAAELATKQPNESRWLRNLMFARQRIGDVFLAQRQGQKAAEEFKDYLRLAQEGVRREPDNKEFAEAVSIAHERIGDAHFVQGDMKGAMQEYRTFQALAATLAKADQSNFIWNQNLEVAHQRIGEVHLREGEFKLALKEFNIYLQMASETLEKDPAHGTARFDVANALEKVGDALRGDGNHAAALRHYRDMLTHSLTLKEKDASNATWAKGLANSHHRIALVLEQQGDRDGALASYRSCTAVTVPGVVWNLRTAEPPDVIAVCRQQVMALSAAAR